MALVNVDVKHVHHNRKIDVIVDAFHTMRCGESVSVRDLSLFVMSL